MDGEDRAAAPSTGSRDGRVVTVDLDWRTALGAAIALVAAVALFSAASTARNALTWIVLGFLFALALEPVVGRVERLLGRRWAAVLAVVLAAAAAVLAVAFLVAPIAAREASHFADDAPKLVERVGDLPLVGGRLVDAKVPEHIQQWVQKLPGQLGTEDAPLVNAFRSALSGVTAAIATVAMVLAVLLDGRRLRNGIRRMVPVAHRDGADRALDILYVTVGRYFAGSLLIAVLAGCGILIVGLLAGVPLAPVAAAWVMVTNLIPQVGGFLGGAFFVLLGATQGPTTLLICLAWFLVYQQFENHVLQPVIVGEAVDLSPPVTMIAALVGASAFGVPGALVAIPVIGTVKAIAIELGWVRARSEVKGEAAGHDEGRLRRLLGVGRR